MIGPQRRCPICGAVSDAEMCPTDGVSTLTVDGLSMGVSSLSVGSVLGGRYKLERLIGKGGFGSVFLARHTGTGQGVAIKTLSAGLENDDRALRRFFQEARVTAGLKHPNTIRVFDFGQEPSGVLFLAMELLTGVTLRTELKTRLEAGRVFTERETIAIGEAVCRSLAEAHAAGLVHRDLKPDNIFLHRVEGDDSVVKVLDFGIVKSPDSSLTLGSDSSAPGTPAYMSPEQVGNRELDGRSDLYSLGVVLFSMVTGVVPFRGRDVLQTIWMHVNEPLPDLRSLARTPLSSGFVEVLERVLAKDPDRRPQDARALRRLLQQCADGEPPSDPSLPRSRASLDGEISIDAPGPARAIVASVAPAAASVVPGEVTPPSGPSASASRPITSEAARVSAERRSRRLITTFAAGTAVVLALLGWLVMGSRREAEVVVIGARENAPTEAPVLREAPAASPAEAPPEASPLASTAPSPSPSSSPAATPSPSPSARASASPTRRPRPTRPASTPAKGGGRDKNDDVLDLKI